MNLSRFQTQNNLTYLTDLQGILILEKVKIIHYNLLKYIHLHYLL